MSEHVLKIHEQPFNDLLSGEKTAEIRNNDRGFQVGDTVRLREIYDGSEAFTGREMRRLITHVQTDYGLPDNRCVLSYAPDIDARKAGHGEAVAAVAYLPTEEDLGIKYNSKAGPVTWFGDPPRGEHLMTVTQHDRIVAAITAPPASADAVSVPRELLERLVDMLVNPIHYNPGAIDKRAEELRTLLAQSQGVKL